MKSTLLNIIVIGSLVAAPAISIAKPIETENKEAANKNEGIGLGIGVIIGGILGGPAGAFITGVAGALLAKDVNAKEDIGELELALQQEKDNYLEKSQLAKQKFHNLEQEYQSELLSLEQNYHAAQQLQAENLLMSLQFPTGSSDLQPHYNEQITALTKLLVESPNLSIDLSGYTDLQGSEDSNTALSLARVESVKQALVSGGINEDRIVTFAYGESAPVVAKADKEVSFYDRRVVIKLHNQGGSQDNNQMANNH